VNGKEQTQEVKVKLNISAPAVCVTCRLIWDTLTLNTEGQMNGIGREKYCFC
jgi:hypothetical protein